MAEQAAANVRLLGISGSLRAGSYNTSALKAMAASLAGTADMSIHLLQAIPLYNQDLDGHAAPAVDELKRAIAEADGLVLCSPEYNYGMSGVLKNAIDWVSRPAMQSVLRDKPVLLMSCSPSAAGGARAHAQMRETMSACLAWVLPRPQLTVADVANRFSAGEISDRRTLGSIDAAGRELVEHIKRLHSPIRRRE